jgi:hypothetical protein
MYCVLETDAFKKFFIFCCVFFFLLLRCLYSWMLSFLIYKMSRMPQSDWDWIPIRIDLKHHISWRFYCSYYSVTIIMPRGNYWHYWTVKYSSVKFFHLLSGSKICSPGCSLEFGVVHAHYQPYQTGYWEFINYHNLDDKVIYNMIKCKLLAFVVCTYSVGHLEQISYWMGFFFF